MKAFISLALMAVMPASFAADGDAHEHKHHSHHSAKEVGQEIKGFFDHQGEKIREFNKKVHDEFASGAPHLHAAEKKAAHDISSLFKSVDKITKKLNDFKELLGSNPHYRAAVEQALTVTGHSQQVGEVLAVVGTGLEKAEEITSSEQYKTAEHVAAQIAQDPAPNAASTLPSPNTAESQTVAGDITTTDNPGVVLEHN